MQKIKHKAIFKASSGAKESKGTNSKLSAGPLNTMKLPYGFSISLHSFLMLVLLVFTFIIFSGSLSNEFLIGWDDGEYITNPDVTNFGRSDIKGTVNHGSGSRIFSSFYLGMYQPLAVLSFALNYKLAGDSAAIFIMVNLLLHLLNVMLVYKLMMKWFSRFELAYVIAFLFALHPMHVEGVVWISTRSSLLYSSFFLAGLLQYEKYLHDLKPKHYIYTLIWVLLSLLSKSMAATFPLILLLVDYFRKRPFTMKLLFEKVPFLILSIIFGIVSIKASSSFGHITVLEQDYDLWERIILMGYGISFYIIKMVLPLNLSAIYAFPEVTNGTFPAWVYLSMIAIPAIILIIWLNKTKRREFIFGTLFFILSISMVLPLFWSRIFITADRYTYIPYLGLSIIAGGLLIELWDRRDSLQSSTKNMVFITTMLLALIMIFSTYNRIKVWHDVPKLLTDVIDNQRSNADIAHGFFYLGNFYDTNAQDEEAIKNYGLAISNNPGYILAFNNRGILKGKHMDSGGAISDFNKAIKLNPRYAEAYYNRGVAYYQLQKPNLACADWVKASELGFKEANNVISQYCYKNIIQPNF